MQPVLVYALYAWVALSALALIVYQVRRARTRRQPVTGTPSDAASTTSTTATATASATATDPPGIGDRLAGIRLPYDLRPVTARGTPEAADTMTVATSSAPAEVVGPAIADELERLGFSLEPSTETCLTARRGDELLHLEMILAPSSHSEHGVRPFADLDDGAVLVRIRVG